MRWRSQALGAAAAQPPSQPRNIRSRPTTWCASPPSSNGRRRPSPGPSDPAVVCVVGRRSVRRRPRPGRARARPPTAARGGAPARPVERAAACHILYVGHGGEPDARRRTSRGQPMLIVTDEAGDPASAGMIHFVAAARPCAVPHRPAAGCAQRPVDQFARCSAWPSASGAAEHEPARPPPAAAGFPAVVAGRPWSILLIAGLWPSLINERDVKRPAGPRGRRPGRPAGRGGQRRPGLRRPRRPPRTTSTPCRSTRRGRGRRSMTSTTGVVASFVRDRRGPARSHRRDRATRLQDGRLDVAAASPGRPGLGMRPAAADLRHPAGAAVSAATPALSLVLGLAALVVVVLAVAPGRRCAAPTASWPTRAAELADANALLQQQIEEREQGRGGPAPEPEDGGDRPADRRHRPRLQQPADGRPRAALDLLDARPTDPQRRDALSDGVRQAAERGAGPDPPAAGLLAPAAAEARGRRPERRRSTGLRLLLERSLREDIEVRARPARRTCGRSRSTRRSWSWPC